jgi:hypothetical protein
LLKHLAISGAAVDIYTLSTALLCAENTKLLHGKEEHAADYTALCGIGTTAANAEVDYCVKDGFELLVEKIKLQTARLVRHPEQTPTTHVYGCELGD